MHVEPVQLVPTWLAWMCFNISARNDFCHYDSLAFGKHSILCTDLIPDWPVFSDRQRSILPAIWPTAEHYLLQQPKISITVTMHFYLAQPLAGDKIIRPIYFFSVHLCFLQVTDSLFCLFRVRPLWRSRGPSQGVTDVHVMPWLLHHLEIVCMQCEQHALESLGGVRRGKVKIEMSGLWLVSAVISPCPYI